MSVATVMLVTMKCSLRTVVLLAVWTFLLIWLYQAILKLQKEETAFNHYDEENAFQWPVVNICPMYWLMRNISTQSFEDVEAEINRTIMHYSPMMLQEGANSDNLQDNTKNLYLNSAEQLRKNNNATVNDVWSFSYTTTLQNDQPLVCVSFNLALLNLTEYQHFYLLLSDPLPTGYVAAISEQKQFKPYQPYENYVMVRTQ